MKAANPREPLSGVCALMPEKILKETFLLSYFSVRKSTKSHLRGLSSLLKNTFRVHELVAGSSAWQVRAAQNKAKIGSFAAPHNLILPRVRTYHTKKPSRFVHASPARPLKVQGGREFGLCADGTIKINPISLCSHPNLHPNLNREVCHSLTWHSSESESARGRFEPVAVVKL